MEILSWIRKVDMRMDKLDLLDIIDHLHGVIDAVLVDNKEKDAIIMELEGKLKKSSSKQ